MSYGSGTAPFTLNCVCADHGSLTSQKPSRARNGLSTTKHSLNEVEPVLNPPPSVSPLSKRPSMFTSMPLYTWLMSPNSDASLTTLFAPFARPSAVIEYSPSMR